MVAKRIKCPVFHLLLYDLSHPFLVFLVDFCLAFDRKDGVNAEFKVVILNLNIYGVDSKNIFDFAGNLELADILWLSRIDPSNDHLARVVEEVLQMSLLIGSLELDIVFS